MGSEHHFLYASRGPSVGQWWLAHGAGGRLVAGAVRVDDPGDTLGPIHPGEVVELNISGETQLLTMIDELASDLRSEHLSAVPVGQLMRDAGTSV